MYDVAIIGGGPAGATLARKLGSHLKVFLLDKKDHSGNGGFEKPCGGLLTPDAQKNMAKFGLGLPSDILADPQIFTVRTLDLHSKMERYYQRFYLNFNRHKFDLWLLDLIKSHVTVVDKARCSKLYPYNNGFSIVYEKDSKTYYAHAKYIVGADGAHSLVRQTFCPRPIRQYTCIQQSYKVDENFEPYYTCFFHPKLTDCYGWINVKDGEAELGVALPKKHSRKNYEIFREYFARKGYPFGKGKETKVQACLVNRPASVEELELGGKGVFLIGEAAGFVSPSSLEGMSYSMESASLLAPILNKKSTTPHKDYTCATKKLKARIFLKLCKVPFMYHPLLRGMVMTSGLTSMSVENAGIKLWNTIKKEKTEE